MRGQFESKGQVCGKGLEGVALSHLRNFNWSVLTRNFWVCRSLEEQLMCSVGTRQWEAPGLGLRVFRYIQTSAAVRLPF